LKSRSFWVVSIMAIIVTLSSAGYYIGSNTYSAALSNDVQSKNIIDISTGTTEDTRLAPPASEQGQEAVPIVVESPKPSTKNTPPIPASLKTVDGKKRVVYLTIDDGPNSVITDRMLDILKKYDVKATFFVIGNLVKGNDMVLKRIQEEGHGIGLHSYTHDIKNIYKSQDVFIKEMLQSSDTVSGITGVKPNVIRFPGGSSKRLNKELLDKLHNLGYKVYDWNISAGDGMYPKNPPEAIFLNAINPSQITSNAILLMHTKANNQNSCEALPRIIEYYKNSGYEFKVITGDTPEYYYKF